MNRIQEGEPPIPERRDSDSSRTFGTGTRCYVSSSLPGLFARPSVSVIQKNVRSYFEDISKYNDGSHLVGS